MDAKIYWLNAHVPRPVQVCSVYLFGILKLRFVSNVQLFIIEFRMMEFSPRVLQLFQPANCRKCIFRKLSVKMIRMIQNKYSINLLQKVMN